MDEITRKEIETVKELLKDDSITLSVESQCKNSGREFELYTGLTKHPLMGLCLVSCLLFKQISKTGNEYDLYQLPKVSYTVCGFNKQNKFISRQEMSQHYFLKHRTTGEIIDITKEQFYQRKLSYKKGVYRDSLNLKSKLLKINPETNQFTTTLVNN